MRENKFGSTRNIAMMGLLIAIQLVLTFTPLGFIQTPVIKATTLHIPVIIAGVLLGPLAGGICGAVMGIMSIYTNSVAPTLTSFVFTPFYSLPNYEGNFWSIVVAIVPRICIGVFAAYTFRFFRKLIKKSDLPAFLIAGLVGSMTNTILVMLGIYVFFGESYAAARGTDFSALFTLIMGVVAVSGTMEAGVAAALSTLIGKPLSKILSKA